MAIPNTSGTSQAHKGYAVRAVDTTGALCAACSVGAWNDTTLYTPVSGGTFSVPVLSVPPDYAGQTITLDIYDPGDLSVGSNLTLSILTPTGAVATRLHLSRSRSMTLARSGATSDRPTCVPLPTPSPIHRAWRRSGSNATIASTVNGVKYFNGHWLHFLLPIPASYNPGTDPNNWWWKLQYTTPAGTTANDTFSMAVGFKGNLGHVLTKLKASSALRRTRTILSVHRLRQRACGPGLVVVKSPPGSASRSNSQRRLSGPVAE